LKRVTHVIVLLCLALPACAQNWTTVSAANLTDLNQQKLATGSMCFLGTDQNDIPLSFQVGGGGQVLARPFCVAVTNGSSAGLLVPNPQNTQPQGIYYRVTVTDMATGQPVLKYTAVSFSGATFNLDNYAPQYPGLVTAPGSTSTPGSFSVGGNLTVTGTISGTYMFGSSAFSALNPAAAYGTFQSVSDKQRGVFIQNFLRSRWIPISPWLNLDHFTKGDAVYLNAVCSSTNASYTVSCSGASFSSGTDVGKLVVLFGSRANGSGATATTTLSSGAVTTPTVTAAGSGYFTRPTAAISGLTCTFNPELKVNLSGSNYSTGNTVSSITVVYGGSGCTGTPTITITAGPTLALAGTIASVTNATTVVLTTNIAPSVTASSLSMLYGSDDAANINSALQALAPNTDQGLNPVSVYCGRLYMTSAAINIQNKAIELTSPGPGNLSSTPAQQGCAFFLANTNYTTPTDALYMAGDQFSSIKGLHLFSVSGNKQRAAVRLQQAATGQNHNTQFNRFSDNLVGPWYTGGANGNDPEASACFTGSFTLNQCAQFQYGFFFDQPNANNDQMMFANNMVVGADIGFYQLADQSAELLLDRFMCDGCAIGIKATANMVVRDSDISNGSDCDIMLGDTAYNGNNLGIVLDLQHYTSEAGHRFLCGDAQTSAVDNISLFFHGQINWQAGSSTIKSGTIIDFSGMNFGPNITLAGDQNIMPTLLGVLPATTAPINFNWFVAGAANGPSLVQNGADLAANVPDPPIANFTNLQLTYPDFRHSQWVKRDWTLNGGQGQRCHTDMIYFGSSPDSIECNNTTVVGKERIFGHLKVNAIGAPSAPTCAKLSGSGATTYFYKIAGVVAGITGPASTETSCASQAASLSSAAINQVCAVPIAGAQQYAIYESTTTGTEKLLATVAADRMVAGGSNTSCYNDAAGGAAGASPVSTDATGGGDFQGPVSAQSLTITGGSGLAVPSLNINGDGTMTENPRVAWGSWVSQTFNGTGNLVAQWPNHTPLKITGIFGIVTGSAPAGCTSPIQFFIHDVALNSNSTAATLSNGGGNTTSATPNFAVNAGDTIQLQYTSVGCTSNALGLNMTVEVEPQ
jgi:hypothetical protein